MRMASLPGRAIAIATLATTMRTMVAGTHAQSDGKTVASNGENIAANATGAES